jgi:hypothetical protein
VAITDGRAKQPAVRNIVGGASHSREDDMSDKRLELLWDHFQIREVLEAYVHGCDRADRDAVADTYHEDSYDHHGPISGAGHQFATDCVQSLVDVWESCNHLLGQSRIKVTGDVAGAETLFFASQTRNQNGEMMMDQQKGRYVDRLERRDGVWRIKDRRCIQEWAMTVPRKRSLRPTLRM